MDGGAGQGKGQYEATLTEENCWLEFWVKWSGYPLTDTEEDWVKIEQLSCPERVWNFPPLSPPFVLRDCFLLHLFCLGVVSCVWLRGQPTGYR